MCMQMYGASIAPLYPLYTEAATFVRPSCHHKMGQVGVEGTKETGRKVAWVIQWWHTWPSDIAMDTMVTVKFWACSKQLHIGRRVGRSLTGLSKEAGGRHTHRRDRRMDAQGSVTGGLKKCVLL